MILTIAKILNLSSRHADFVLAFAQDDLVAEICVKLHQGTQQKDEEKCVLKLNKSLCSLKQGSHNWFQKLRQALLDRKYRVSAVDRCG